MLGLSLGALGHLSPLTGEGRGHVLPHRPHLLLRGLHDRLADPYPFRFLQLGLGSGWGEGYSRSEAALEWLPGARLELLGVRRGRDLCFERIDLGLQFLDQFLGPPLLLLRRLGDHPELFLGLC